ncbi:unnamed protein product [Chrysoparadoxa australica]
MAASKGMDGEGKSKEIVPSEVKLMIAVTGIYTCYISSGILQEAITSYSRSDAGEKFTYTLFMLWGQCLVNVMFAAVAMTIAGRSGDKMPQHLFATAGCGYISAMVCSLEALQYVSFPMKELGKSCKMIPVMIFGVLFAQKRYSIRDYTCVALITAGIITFNMGGKQKTGKENSSYGLMLLALSLILDGVTGSAQERLKKACTPTVHEMMFHMNLWAFTILTLACVVTGQGLEGFKFCHQNPVILQHLIGFASAAALGQNFIYFTIKNFNPLVCTTITTTRKFFTILCSVIWFRHPMSVQQWSGVALVFAGIGGEMVGKYHKSQALKAKKA